MFAIKKIGKGGYYVTRPGSKKSYVRGMMSKNVRLYKTRQEAEKDLCPENERVVEFGFGAHGREW